MEQRCAECNCGEGPCNWMLAPQVQLKSACNALSLMDMGMSETAAARIAKQWEQKCAEVAELRAENRILQRWVCSQRHELRHLADRVAALTQEQR